MALSSAWNMIIPKEKLKKLPIKKPESRSAQEEKFLSLDHASINHSCPLSSEAGLYGKVKSFALVLV
jgi:hypothetical protein